jgi:Sulfotransferase family
MNDRINAAAESASRDAADAADLLPICPNPVFIIGSPRSGTTVLARSLAQHSELWTSGESYVLFHLYGPPNFAERVFDRAMAIPGPRWLRREEVSREEFFAYVGMSINALMTNRSEGRRWIDHTPVYTLIADRLAEVFPGASFIHILRDGREVVNSMLNFADSLADPAAARFVDQAMAWARDMRSGCDTWRNHVETAMAFCDQHTDRATVVRYEDLVAEPQEAFRNLHRFLGIVDEEGAARFLASRRINSSFGDRPRPSADELWETWDEEWRRVFADHAGAAMVRCGYWTADELAASENHSSAGQAASGERPQAPAS